MNIRLYKYQATGNDFILADNREKNITLSNAEVSQLCHRRFGIGADGVIVLEKSDAADFRMIYRNADGSESFCGNGCRAAVHFANKLGIIKNTTTFQAHDGLHTAEILSNGFVRFSLADVNVIEPKGDDFYINTGTDHNIRFVKNLSTYPVFEEGKKIRYSDIYKPKGTNADFVEVNADQSVSFRIYERGVEDETYSSGSGATACALVVAKKYNHTSPITLTAPGGILVVDFEISQNGTFRKVHLTGPVQLVFETTAKLPLEL